MPDGVAHWDDVAAVRTEGRVLRGARRRLGPAAGAAGVGLGRYDLGPGERPMPVHAHADEEEILFVLRGSGITTDGERAWPIAAGDAVVHVAGGEPHAFAAGDDGMSVLVFASGSQAKVTWYPRGALLWTGPRWRPAVDGRNPLSAEEDAGPLDLPAPEAVRPPHVVALADVAPSVDEHDGYRGEERDLGRAVGSVASGLRHATLDPGQTSCPPHWHGDEEELFVVLDGDGELLLLDADLAETRHPLRAGSVVARPPATGVAHALVAGDRGLTYLAYGTRRPGEVVYYPRSRKAYLGPLLVRVDPDVDYWDGET
jgi:uncharacterized cupin superfamily protein